MPLCKIGFIFQSHNLISELSLQENVLLPTKFSNKRAKISGENKFKRLIKTQDLLTKLGLKEYLNSDMSVTNLSVGQQQRVALARAVIGEPSLILADEPTSALDESIKRVFLNLLLSECRNAGSSLIFVSHDRTLSKFFDKEILIN